MLIFPGLLALSDFKTAVLLKTIQSRVPTVSPPHHLTKKKGKKNKAYLRSVYLNRWPKFKSAIEETQSKTNVSATPIKPLSLQTNMTEHLTSSPGQQTGWKKNS